MKALGIIPARLESTRLPGKLLLTIGARPLIRHVWERARRARRLDRLVIATDSDAIARVAADFGAEVERTSGRPRSGTERCAEVARRLAARLVVNIQGDELGVTGAMVDALVGALEHKRRIDLVTLSQPIERREELRDPSVVKVVTDVAGRALYFSRAPIPYLPARTAARGLRRHIGLYGYRRSALLALAAARPSRLERLEGLEQLRWLEAGRPMLVLRARTSSLEINTAADLARARARWRPGDRRRRGQLQTGPTRSLGGSKWPSTSL